MVTQYIHVSKLTNNDFIGLELSNRLHPPFVLRLLNLSKILTSEYVDYAEDKFDDLNLSFKVTNVGEADAKPGPGLYDNLYPDPGPSRLTETNKVDLAILLSLRTGTQPSEGEPRVQCTDGHKNLRYHSSPFKCARVDIYQLLRCTAHLSDLFASPPAPCGPPILAKLRDDVRLIHNLTVNDVWGTWAEYAVAIVKIDEALREKQSRQDPLEGVVEFLYENSGAELALWALNLCIEIKNKDVSSKEARQITTDLSELGRDISSKSGDYSRAIEYGKVVISGWDYLAGGKTHPGMAYHRAKLASIYLDGPQYHVLSLPMDTFENTYVPSAIRLFRAAAKIRNDIMISADHADFSSPDEKAKAVKQVREQSLIAANDVVHTLIAQNLCDQALEFIGDVADGFARLDPSPGLKAISLENMSSANSCAKAGNPRIALLAAKWALGLRGDLYKAGKQDSDDDQSLSDRLLKGYFTLWEAAERAGDDKLCAIAAHCMSQLYEEETRKHLNPEIGTFIDGKYVSMKRCRELSDGEMSK